MHISDNNAWHIYTDQELPLKDLVHIFYIDVNAYYDQIKPAGVLSVEELAKANRFRKKDDYASFVVSHYFLRIILAQVLQIPPSCIEYNYTRHKKPVLNTINFNISHTKDKVTIALAQKPVGIDIEYINQDFDFRDIIEQCFSAEESSFIFRNKPTVLKEGITEHPALNFFTLWTRKEALLKATGEGLIQDLKKVPALDKLVTRNNEIFHVESYQVSLKHVISVAYDAKAQLKLWDYRHIPIA